MSLFLTKTRVRQSRNENAAKSSNANRMNRLRASKTLFKLERCRAWTVVAATAPWTNHLRQLCRCLRAFLDRPPPTASNFLSYSSTWTDCSIKCSLVYDGGLFSSTAHLRILIAALKSRFTNSIRFVPLGVALTNASSPRIFALLSICSSVSGPYFAISSGLRWHFSISTF